VIELASVPVLPFFSAYSTVDLSHRRNLIGAINIKGSSLVFEKLLLISAGVIFGTGTGTGNR
jgi:hypothetical protein